MANITAIRAMCAAFERPSSQASRVSLTTHRMCRLTAGFVRRSLHGVPTMCHALAHARAAGDPPRLHSRAGQAVVFHRPLARQPGLRLKESIE